MVSIFLKPYPWRMLPSNTKIYYLVLALIIKHKNRLLNYYNLKVQICINSNVDSRDKSIVKYLIMYLADSLCFTIIISTFCCLWILIIDIANCF